MEQSKLVTSVYEVGGALMRWSLFVGLCVIPMVIIDGAFFEERFSKLLRYPMGAMGAALAVGMALVLLAAIYDRIRELLED